MDAFRGITIDPEGAADLDDAIHVERDGDGWLVQVAIPDCREVVPAGSPLDLSAREVGATIYSARGIRRHMLSQGASETLSLTPGEEKRVFLVSVSLDAALTPSTPVVLPSTFLSAGRLSYGDANKAIRDKAHPQHALLSLADTLAGALSRKRAKSGALGLRDIGNGLQTDEEGRLHRGPVHAAERIVAELMVLANTSLAALCAEQGVRILFRNHAAKATASREALLESLKLAGLNLASEDTVTQRLNLLVGRATLGPTVEGHWGLNLPAYAWFTSPIRRYADLVNQRILAAWANGQPLPNDDLEALAAHLDAVRDPTANWLKGRAAAEAEARIQAGNFSKADATAFTGMLKASGQTGEVPDAMVEESLLRLAKGTLSSKDIARLLAMSPEVAGRIVSGMAGRTQEAVSVANYIAQANGTPQPVYEETSDGPAHAKTFGVVAAVEVSGKWHASPSVGASSLKEARQRATLHALALAFGATPPAWESSRAPVTATQPAKAHVVAPGTNPKNAVLEICQARKWPMPTFEVTQDGPPHKPTFAAVAAIEAPGRRFTSSKATAASRKAAEIAACKDLLGQLR